MRARHRHKSWEKTIDLVAKETIQRTYANPHTVAPAVPDLTERFETATAELTSNAPVGARFIDERGGYIFSPG
jgi:hypothetical protein